MAPGSSCPIHTVALKLDRPWEPVTGACITVICDEEKYRMYCRGRPPRVQTPESREVGCYAESDNGISWTPSNLELHKGFSTKNNNVILADVGHNAVNVAPFVDR